MPGSLQGRVNVYTCRGRPDVVGDRSGAGRVTWSGGCGARLVTIDRDAGVTPMFLGCRAQGGNDCNGDMASAMYDAEATAGLAPTHEWYSPDRAELRRLERSGQRALVAHVEAGGLLLRRIGERGG